MGKWGEAWPESACWMCGGGGGGGGGDGNQWYVSLRCGVHVAQWYALFCFVHMVWYGLELCFRVALLPSSACCDLWTLACPWRRAGMCE